MAFGQPISINAFDAALKGLQNKKFIPVKAVEGKEEADFSLLYDENGEQKLKNELNYFNKTLLYSDDFKAYF